ncbi:MAG: flagellar hook capping FlgD N-terminal domain-containing protein [Thermodesulfobacteriota bacterium]|jgi:flagellar basal-body rod modification protein FlgD
MSVSSVTPTVVTPTVNSSSTAASAQSITTLTQQDFMNLFVAQMQYQNPLEPMSDSDMATQLAQLNTVNALTTMNNTLNEMMTNQASQNNLQATSLIGKTIEATGNSLSIQNGVVSNGAYQLSQPGNVTIQISDSSGNLVRQINAGSQDTSMQSIGWDGKNQQGVTLPDGTYTFQVSATDQSGNAVSATTYLLGTVNGVSFQNGAAVYQVGGNNINFSDILAISN